MKIDKTERGFLTKTELQSVMDLSSSIERLMLLRICSFLAATPVFRIVILSH